jgi:hypothetical protein
MTVSRKRSVVLSEARAGQVAIVGEFLMANNLALWMARPGTAELLRGLVSSGRVRLGYDALPESYGQAFGRVVSAVEDAHPSVSEEPMAQSCSSPPADAVADGASIHGRLE